MNEHLETSGTEEPSNSAHNEVKNKKDGVWQFVVEVARFAAIALLIVIPFRIFIAQPYIVSGGSMLDTFQSGDYLIVDQLTYRLAGPERGDVAIFRFPKNPKLFFIKRIIGLPGETVDIRNGSVSIQNVTHPDGFALEEPYIRPGAGTTLSQKLNDGEYFVLGDNRGESLDSRSWGILPKDNLVGRAFVRLFPLTGIAVFPGRATYLVP